MSYFKPKQWLLVREKPKEKPLPGLIAFLQMASDANVPVSMKLYEEAERKYPEYFKK